MTPSAADGVVRRVFDNGLVAVVRPMSHAPVATVWAWYRVGSRNEVLGLTGASHWVEHMLFKGTARYGKGEIDRVIAREGGHFNGMTWLDWTAYFETLPADRIELGLDLEADRMVNSLFDVEEVASERTVIISEREGYENSPQFQLGEDVTATAFKVHPYHHEVIGWTSDLETMTREDLVAHYRRHYHPANAVVVAAGAFESEEMLDRIHAHFGKLERGAPPTPVTAVEPPARGERRVEVVGTDETASLMVAYPAPRAIADDYFAFQVLDAILGGAKSMNVFGGSPPNRSSRLYKALVESELAVHVASGMAATIDPYLYSVSAVVRPDKDPAAVEGVIAAEVARIRDVPVTEAELARAKKQARAHFAYSAESVSDVGFWLGFAEMVADQAWLADHMERLDAVTADDVARTAATHLRDEARVVGHYVPASRRNGRKAAGAGA